MTTERGRRELRGIASENRAESSAPRQSRARRRAEVAPPASDSASATVSPWKSGAFHSIERVMYHARRRRRSGSAGRRAARTRLRQGRQSRAALLVRRLLSQLLILALPRDCRVSDGAGIALREFQQQHFAQHQRARTPPAKYRPPQLGGRGRRSGSMPGAARTRHHLGDKEITPAGGARLPGGPRRRARAVQRARLLVRLRRPADGGAKLLGRDERYATELCFQILADLGLYEFYASASRGLVRSRRPTGRRTACRSTSAPAAASRARTSSSAAAGRDRRCGGGGRARSRRRTPTARRRRSTTSSTSSAATRRCCSRCSGASRSTSG